MRESFLGFLSNDFEAGELGSDTVGLCSISIDTFSATGVLHRNYIKKIHLKDISIHMRPLLHKP